MYFRLIVLRLIALAAILAASASLLNYMLAEPPFCIYREGCEAVMRSGYGYPLGIPVPAIGLVAFTCFYALTLFPATWLGRLIRPAAIIAGVAGIGFIALQALAIGAFCALCVVTDTAAILLAVVALIGAFPKEARHRLPRARRGLWTLAALVAVFAPLVVWVVTNPP